VFLSCKGVAEGCCVSSDTYRLDPCPCFTLRKVKCCAEDHIGEEELCGILTSQPSSPKDMAPHTVGIIAVDTYHQQRQCFAPFPATLADITSASKKITRENQQRSHKIIHHLTGETVAVNLWLREGHWQGSSHQ